MIWGVLFLILSNYFGIWPAIVVRYAVDYVTNSFSVYRLFEGGVLSKDIFNHLEVGVLILGGLMILMALLRGFSCFS